MKTYDKNLSAVSDLTKANTLPFGTTEDGITEADDSDSDIDSEATSEMDVDVVAGKDLPLVINGKMGEKSGEGEDLSDEDDLEDLVEFDGFEDASSQHGDAVSVTAKEDGEDEEQVHEEREHSAEDAKKMRKFFPHQVSLIEGSRNNFQNHSTQRSCTYPHTFITSRTSIETPPPGLTKIKNALSSLEHKGAGFRLPASAVYPMLPDFSGALPAGTVYAEHPEGTPEHQESNDGESRPAVPALFSRLPTFLPTDIRTEQLLQSCPPGDLKKFRRHGLAFFSTLGERSLASKLSGGDFDGDECTIIWLAALVRLWQSMLGEEGESGLEKLVTSVLGSEKLLQSGAAQQSSISSMGLSDFTDDLDESLSVVGAKSTPSTKDADQAKKDEGGIFSWEGLPTAVSLAFTGLLRGAATSEWSRVIHLLGFSSPPEMKDGETSFPPAMLLGQISHEAMDVPKDGTDPAMVKKKIDEFLSKVKMTKVRSRCRRGGFRIRSREERMEMFLFKLNNREQDFLSSFSP